MAVRLSKQKKHIEIDLLGKNGREIVLVGECKFKNAGACYDLPSKKGLAAVVSQLLFRKINNFSVGDTNDRLRKSGIRNLSVRALHDDTEISFLFLKDRAEESFKFLSSAFSNPTFSDGDSEYIKEFYPSVLDIDTSHPQSLMAEKIDNLLYENGSYGMNITGTSQTISGIGREDILNFIKTKFTLKNAEVTFGGNISGFEAECFLKILFEKLPESYESPVSEETPKLLTGNISKEKLIKINHPGMENIVGIMIGIRTDSLSEFERAARDMLADMLFGEYGDFNKGLRAENIISEISYVVSEKEFSDTLYLIAFVDKKDSEKYQKFAEQKINSYGKKINPKDFKNFKKNFIKFAHNNFIDMNKTDSKVKSKL